MCYISAMRRGNIAVPHLVRFLEYMGTPDPKTGCWLWKGQINSAGYGVLWMGKEHKPVFVGAHRYSYEHFVGPIPDGMFVCHSCDNPPCMNPAHLWLGTAAENVQDKMDKGRQYRAASIPSKPFCKNGHNYERDGYFLYGRTVICRLCHNARRAKWRGRRKAAGLSAP